MERAPRAQRHHEGLGCTVRDHTIEIERQQPQAGHCSAPPAGRSVDLEHRRTSHPILLEIDERLVGLLERVRLGLGTNWYLGRQG